MVLREATTTHIAVARGLREARTRGAAPPVRLTRRGRIVVLVALLVMVALVTGLAASASRAADAPPASRIAVVLPDDTLWSIAARHVPGGEPYATIEQIRRLNRLSDYTVHPGQALRLPGGA